MTGRVLGIDYGRARVGLALSDGLGLTAQPLAVLRNTGVDALLDALEKVIVEREVTRLVVGLPLSLDGSEGPAAAGVRVFAAKLTGRFELPVALWDERLSTAQAERAMLDADLSRAQRKKRRDKVAAQVFLQSWLDAHRSAPG
ncbi:MAG TPA: Holliday junction resolvase RuvX [Planctomycetota bacterium]|nr:Holliday junction resolvase RuvX [Planctomycetota bacterium]